MRGLPGFMFEQSQYALPAGIIAFMAASRGNPPCKQQLPLWPIDNGMAGGCSAETRGFGAVLVHAHCDARDFLRRLPGGRAFPNIVTSLRTQEVHIGMQTSAGTRHDFAQLRETRSRAGATRVNEHYQ